MDERFNKERLEMGRMMNKKNLMQAQALCISTLLRTHSDCTLKELANMSLDNLEAYYGLVATMGILANAEIDKIKEMREETKNVTSQHH